MTLESIYYIGQTIAVLALVMSLIFVGMQMRRANELARNEVSDRVVEAFAEKLQTVMADAEFSAVFMRAYAGRSDFSEEEWGRLALFTSMIINSVRSFISAKQRGLMEPIAEEAGMRTICFFLSQPAFARIWRWHEKSGAHNPAIFDVIRAEFDKRYPKLAGSLRIDRKMSEVPVDASSETKEEPST